MKTPKFPEAAANFRAREEANGRDARGHGRNALLYLLETGRITEGEFEMRLEMHAPLDIHAAVRDGKRARREDGDLWFNSRLGMHEGAAGA